MSFDDLPDFLDRLEKDGDLVRVKAQVDPHLEITEIVDRVVRAGGPALLFENVKGSKLPLAMNVFGVGVIRDFAFAMNVGVIVGTYSSIFIASPILIWLNDKYVTSQKRQQASGRNAHDSTSFLDAVRRV